MTKQNAFGGEWTRKKLVLLDHYLHRYMEIMARQDWATTVYVDAFAGTGTIPAKLPRGLFEDDDNMRNYLDGSVRKALSLPTPFDHYLFIEQDADKCDELHALKRSPEFQHLSPRIQVEQADMTKFLPEWIAKTNWHSSSSLKPRAVMFLDPCGMQVEFDLLEHIANTRAIDLWLLVPIGIGALRLITDNLPPQPWQERLTKFLGSDEWRSRFYAPPAAGSLFDGEPEQKRIASYKALADYFLERLEMLFGKGKVAPHPLTQVNSQGKPLYILCFASANDSAIKIASHLLEYEPKTKPKRRG